jgi:hypothetical protein
LSLAKTPSILLLGHLILLTPPLPFNPVLRNPLHHFGIAKQIRNIPIYRYKAWGDKKVPAFRCLGGSSSCDYPANPPGMRQPAVKKGSGEERSGQEKSAVTLGK